MDMFHVKRVWEKMEMSNNTGLYDVSESWRWESTAISGTGRCHGRIPHPRGPRAESGLGNKAEASISVFT